MYVYVANGDGDYNANVSFHFVSFWMEQHKLQAFNQIIKKTNLNTIEVKTLVQMRRRFTHQ